MKTYTQSELEALLLDGESDLVERKASWDGDAPEKGRQAICAFANDLPGHGRRGVLFVGARDDGTPAGLPITDRLLLTLADIKTDGNLLPPPTLVVQKVVLCATPMAVVQVAPMGCARLAGTHIAEQPKETHKVAALVARTRSRQAAKLWGFGGDESPPNC